MQVLIVKDGTVPLVVAEVLAHDWGELEPYEGIGDIDHDYIEVFEVEGKPEALGVVWADGDGFSVFGTTIEEWMKDAQADDTGGPVEVVNGKAGQLHLVQSEVTSGDERWYSHLFVLA